MAYPVSTSIHLCFDEALTLNEQIEKHTAAGFCYLDFNFLDWQNVKDSPLLADGWEKWIDSAGETAARLLHDVGMALVNTSKNGKALIIDKRDDPPSRKTTEHGGFSYPSRRLGMESTRKARCISSAPRGLYLMLVLAHRLHGGTPCYVPSLTEHSREQSARGSLVQARTHSRLIITRQRASYLRLDDIQTFGLMIYQSKLRMICTALP